MSRQIIVSVDSVGGKINIAIVVDGIKQNLELLWKKSSEGYSGFVTNFHPSIIRLTDAASQLFVSNLVNIIRHVVEVDEGDISILNDRGEHLSEVQFIPPTFMWGAEEISALVDRQEILAKFYAAYEDSGRQTTAGLIEACAENDILDDFLCILESKLIGIQLNLECLINKTEE